MVQNPANAENPFGRMSVRELLVDFFGSLVPGMVFVAATAIVLLWPVLAALPAIRQAAAVTPPLNVGGFLDSTSSLLGSFWIETLLFTLMLSYVAGHLFYRQDPKVPDQRSFKYISRGWTDDQKEQWPARSLKECEFPYHNLRGYLAFRGLEHLVKMVPWPGEDGVQRTKNFINILKIRLGWHYPEKCGAISRNEAHVRLMSSMWYVSRALWWVSFFGLVFGIAECVFAIRWLSLADRGVHLPVNFVPVMMSFIGFAAAWAAGRIIERFLHYQRVREIVFVLETAYTGFRDNLELIWDVCPDLRPRQLPEGSESTA